MIRIYSMLHFIMLAMQLIHMIEIVEHYINSYRIRDLYSIIG